MVRQGRCCVCVSGEEARGGAVGDTKGALAQRFQRKELALTRQRRRDNVDPMAVCARSTGGTKGDREAAEGGTFDESQSGFGGPDGWRDGRTSRKVRERVEEDVDQSGAAKPAESQMGRGAMPPPSSLCVRTFNCAPCICEGIETTTSRTNG